MDISYLSKQTGFTASRNNWRRLMDQSLNFGYVMMPQFQIQIGIERLEKDVQ